MVEDTYRGIQLFFPTQDPDPKQSKHCLYSCLFCSYLSFSFSDLLSTLPLRPSPSLERLPLERIPLERAWDALVRVGCSLVWVGLRRRWRRRYRAQGFHPWVGFPHTDSASAYPRPGSRWGCSIDQYQYRCRSTCRH